ncbi:MAG TPA: hypothetical protein VMM17_11235 [Gemmatimonadaceae bacterium]|nr:hypothetical protein [Gemmatimonadaceae bacterium]
MSPSTAHALFWTCTAACAAGQGALIWSAIRRFDRASTEYEDDRRTTGRRHRVRWSPDRRTDQETPEPEASAVRELVWTLLPAVGLALLLAATWAALP